MMELNSQRVRGLAPENDPLKIGMGWTVEDLDKPQIMVESTFGDSHPGSAHLDLFVNEALGGLRTREEKARGILQRISATALPRAMTESIIPLPTGT